MVEEGDGAAPAAILSTKQDKVAIITLNDPARLNAIDHGPGSRAEELLSALEAADADDGIHCIVLTGARRAFSSGGDVGREPPVTAVDHYRFLEMPIRLTDRIRGLRKPTIGAINGICYGFGLVLATHLDLLVAARSARFGLIETRFGSTGAQTLPFLIGPQWAKFLALTGEIISAEKAKEIGLVLETVDDDDLMPRAGDLARRVAAMPREAVMFNRRVINGALTMMGWEQQRDFAHALNTITNQMVPGAQAADGRVLSEVLVHEGWSAYKAARDAAFDPPWLER